jgi:hypothetical protein
MKPPVLSPTKKEILGTLETDQGYQTIGNLAKHLENGEEIEWGSYTAYSEAQATVECLRNGKREPVFVDNFGGEWLAEEIRSGKGLGPNGEPWLKSHKWIDNTTVVRTDSQPPTLFLLKGSDGYWIALAQNGECRILSSAYDIEFANSNVVMETLKAALEPLLPELETYEIDIQPFLDVNVEEQSILITAKGEFGTYSEDNDTDALESLVKAEPNFLRNLVTQNQNA